MGRKKRKEKATKKQKEVKVDVVARLHAGKVVKIYETMERVLDSCHPQLFGAKVAIAWRYDNKPDADGRMWLGSLKRASELDRSLHEYDFVLSLNYEFCNKAATDEQIEALIDHFLCHGQVAKDANGEPKEDTKNRTIFRTRKCDIQEFTEVVARRGAYTSDLEKFFGVWKERKERPLLGDDNKPKPAGAKFSEPALNGHASPWAQSIDVLPDLSPEISTALKEAKLGTLGAIREYEQAGNDLSAVKGMGSERSEAFGACWKKYREAHPEVVGAA